MMQKWFKRGFFPSEIKITIKLIEMLRNSSFDKLEIYTGFDEMVVDENV